MNKLLIRKLLSNRAHYLGGLVLLSVALFWVPLECQKIHGFGGNIWAAETKPAHLLSNARGRSLSAPAQSLGPTLPQSVGSDSPLPPIHRTVIHTEAYKKRQGLGQHINFKITPPEKRGRKGRVLVEAYNYSKVNLSVMDFWLILSNQWGDRVEVQITCDDISPGWSALKWVKIPGERSIPEITKVEIRNMKIFNEKGREVKLKYYTDLIKQ